ncbi:hypothetical protein KR215_008957 [Drosophila sulfurigaster]|nr:hypothetical protein KR215_008957 [Drosophila sulfurigaster]
MLALTKSNCGDLLLLLILVFTTPLLDSLSHEQPVVDIIQHELQERPIGTLLVLKRKHHLNCTFATLHSLQIPTLRKDDLTTFEMKFSFKSDVMSVVCMTELSDSVLLTVLAKDLHQMRESRIIVWLQTDRINPKAFLDTICDLSSTNNFLKLMVIHSNSYDVKKKPIVYRLQPFPSPSLVPITDKSFVKTWHNFMGRTAVILNDLLAPNSMLTTEIRTGKQKFVGYSDRLIIEFAKKYNITLKLKMPLSDVNKMDYNDIYQLTMKGELDLPIRYFANSPLPRSSQIEFVSVLYLESLFIVVPCGKEMSLEDVYLGLRTYSTIVLIAYFTFAILETLLVAAFYRIIKRRYRFSLGNLLINMCALRGVLGIGIPMNRYGNSLSLKQMVIVMSIFSLIFSCLFNANLSTLLIIQPHHSLIENFEELRESKLTTVVEERLYNYTKRFIDKNLYGSELPNVLTVTPRQQEQMLCSLNTSYAYQILTSMWKAIDIYQKRYRLKVMCRSPGLRVSDLLISGILMNNSVYKMALNEFMHQSASMEFYQHWISTANQKMVETFSNNNLGKPQEHVPLKLDDLKWLWKLMGICYAVAGIVFAAELLVGH